LFFYGEYEDDRFNAYQYQAALAVGYSDRLWDSEKSELRYSIGPGYALSRLNKEEQGQEQSGLILRAAIEYEKNITETATFRQFVSTEADSKFSRSVSETSLAAKINGSLAMKLSLNMTHNKSPDNNGKSLDTQTAVTLVYNFY
jgi:putative salt-induced outer membrane protein YdiY